MGFDTIEINLVFYSNGKMQSAYSNYFFFVFLNTPIGVALLEIKGCMTSEPQLPSESNLAKRYPYLQFSYTHPNLPPVPVDSS